MTKEKREEIRNRPEYSTSVLWSVFAKVAEQDIADLLDALDKAEIRIKALEKALQNTSGRCSYCFYGGKGSLIPPCVTCTYKYGNAWQFDQARFEKEEMT